MAHSFSAYAIPAIHQGPTYTSEAFVPKHPGGATYQWLKSTTKHNVTHIS